MGAYAFESITVADTAIGFTAARLTEDTALYGQECKEVLCTVETAQIRFLVNGTTPTSTVGHILNVGDIAEIDGADASKFLAIRTGASSGELKCTFKV